MKSKKNKISVVIPVFNEENNVAPLYRKLISVFEKIGANYEIIFVDDGSRDRTLVNLKTLPSITIIHLRRNFGQTIALVTGIKEAQGETIVTLDGDLQNDPEDIPKLLAKFDEGFDLVNGWRHRRQDPLSKKIPSRVANWLASKISGLSLHDNGCSLKVFRKELVSNLELRGELHRLIPMLAVWRGAKVAEVKVKHHRRVSGFSKYGLSRVPRVVLDLITMKFLYSYLDRPMQIFGGVGLFLSFIGFCISIVLAWQRLLYGIPLFNRPLLLLGVLLVVIGFQFLCVGLLAEISIRTYFNTTNKNDYIISDKTINRKQ